MHTEILHEAFKEMINKPAIYNTLKISRTHVMYMRWRVRNNLNITLNTKIKYLQKAGYRLEKYQYTDADLMDLVIFSFNVSKEARGFGAAYIIEKWKSKRNHLGGA